MFSLYRPAYNSKIIENMKISKSEHVINFQKKNTAYTTWNGVFDQEWWENYAEIGSENSILMFSTSQTWVQSKNHRLHWFSRNFSMRKSLFLIKMTLMLWQFRILKSFYDLNDPIREMVIFTIPRLLNCMRVCDMKTWKSSFPKRYRCNFLINLGQKLRFR